MIGFRTLVKLLEKDSFSIRVAVRSQASFERLVSLKPIVPFVSQLERVIVPDITVPGAYDEAVKGVSYIIHVASPIATDNAKDFEVDLIQPAVQGTVGILESAHKTTGVKKIVITASVASVADKTYLDNGLTVTGTKTLLLLSVFTSMLIQLLEETRGNNTTRPFPDKFVAYTASKGLSFAATDEFIQKNKPEFNVVRILPTYVLGRDDTVTDVAQITKGTNSLLMAPLLGYPLPIIPAASSVHLEDVANLHIWVLDPSIADNQDFLASNPEPFTWGQSFDIVKKRYPEQYAAGLFKIDGAQPPDGDKFSVDSAKAMKRFGFQFKTFEEQVTSVVDHYVELATAK